MDDWLTIVGAVLGVFGVVAVGFFVRRAGWLTEEADQSLLKLVVRVLLPCLIFDTILGNEALMKARNLVLPPLVGLGTTLLGFALAFAVARLLGRAIGLETRVKQRTFAMATGMYNYGYIPIPLIQLLFDDKTLGVLFVHNLGVEIAFWTAGVALVGGAVGGRWWRNLLNMPLAAIVLALLANKIELQSYLPDLVENPVLWALGSLGASAVPIGLVLVGATVADAWSGAGLGLRVVTASSVLRLGVLPVLFLLLAWVLSHASLELRRVMVVQAAMPSAVFPIILAKHYGGDARTALHVALGTSLLALVTAPLWMNFGIDAFNLAPAVP